MVNIIISLFPSFDFLKQLIDLFIVFIHLFFFFSWRIIYTHTTFLPLKNIDHSIRVLRTMNNIYLNKFKFGSMQTFKIRQTFCSIKLFFWDLQLKKKSAQVFSFEITKCYKVSASTIANQPKKKKKNIYIYIYIHIYTYIYIYIHIYIYIDKKEWWEIRWHALKYEDRDRKLFAVCNSPLPDVKLVIDAVQTANVSNTENSMLSQDKGAVIYCSFILLF